MRDGLGVLLVAIGLTLTLVTRDKMGLLVAFAGITLLAVGVFAVRSAPAGRRQLGQSRCKQVVLAAAPPSQRLGFLGPPGAAIRGALPIAAPTVAGACVRD